MDRDRAAGRYRLARPTETTAGSFDGKPSIAVLPFANFSDDAGQGYFADGMVEDLITALSRFKTFAVVARNSSFVYKGRSYDVREAAKALGVTFLTRSSATSEPTGRGVQGSHAASPAGGCRTGHRSLRSLSAPSEPACP